MVREDIDILLKQLKDQGFEVAKFSEELERKVNRRGSKFSIDQVIEFGEVAMHCTLWFVKQHNSDKFEFNSYNSYYLHEINLKHTKINDLDTAELEMRMQQIDWKLLQFKDNTGLSNQREKLIKEIKEISEDLWKLSNYGASYRRVDLEVRHLADLLRMKYLLNTVLETPKDRRTSNMLQRPASFYTEHVNVAFQIVSGKLFGIEELLSDAQMNCDKIQVAAEVASNKSHISLNATQSFSDGALHYRIPFVKTEEKYGNSEDYYPCQIEATLIVAEQLDFKKKVNGISIGRLDKKMKRIDWQDGYKNVPFWKDPLNRQYDPAIARVMLLLKQIESDKAGKEIALKLKLKYWIGTPLLDAVINRARLEQKKTFPKQTFKLFSNTEKVYQSLYVEYLKRRTIHHRQGRPRKSINRGKGI